MKNPNKNANRWSTDVSDKPTTKDDVITMDGIVQDSLPNAMFRVKLNSGLEILCTLAGKLKQNRIRVLVGDLVSVDISPYDLTKGRITWRR